MSDDVKKKELGYQPGYDSGCKPGYDPGCKPGYDPGYNPGYGPGYNPGCPGCEPGNDGMCFYDRLKTLVGNNVTAYWVDGSAFRGSLQEVGKDYVVIQRNADGNREAVYLPAQNVAITGPVLE